MPTWGRGGAGNIVAGAQIQEQSKISEDLEANRSLASSAAPVGTSAPTSQPPADYAHMGRGGAGNWYQPKELSNEGTFTQTSDSTALPTTSTPNISTPWHPENQQMPIARVGRGGAGNFVWQDEDKELERRGNEERVKKGLEEKVERDVEAGLAKPRAAVLGGEKAGKGW